MPAPKTAFVCQQCGTASPKWAGQCPSCGAWNTLVETAVTPRVARASGSPAGLAAGSAGIEPIGAVVSAEAQRIASGLGEVDRVLGGGFVPGSIVLFGGDPGIGKSTLLLQLAARLSGAGETTLYVSAEESAGERSGSTPWSRG